MLLLRRFSRLSSVAVAYIASIARSPLNLARARALNANVVDDDAGDDDTSAEAPKRRRRCDTSALLPFSLLPLRTILRGSRQGWCKICPPLKTWCCWTFLSLKRCESIPWRILSVQNGSPRRRLSSNVKPDSNIAHRESDARDGDGFWFSSLAVGVIFSGRRCCIVPKDVLRHRRGRTRTRTRA